MENISKLEDIKYADSPLITFKATVTDLLSEGDSEKKRPIKAVLKLEESGQSVEIASWDFDDVDLFKEAWSSDFVYEFTAKAGVYGDYGEQIRVGSISKLQQKSSRKIIKVAIKDSLKKDITDIINLYVPKNSKYRKFLDALVLENEKFWTWPAANKIHHNYPGGLATHSLNVCKNAISIWQTYQGSNLDIALIVTGSLLHDIGKINEYNEDNSRTKYGDLIPHICDGYRIIIEYAIKLGLDPASDTEVTMLSHVILSHHDKLEFGSPVKPTILEAMVVAKSDYLDSTFEAMDRSLDNLQLNETSDFMKVNDGTKVYKWHE